MGNFSRCTDGNLRRILEELEVNFLKLATLPHLNRFSIDDTVDIHFSHQTVTPPSTLFKMKGTVALKRI